MLKSLLICLFELLAVPLDNAYLGAPQLDGPVERRGNKQMGEVQGSCSCVAVDPRDGAVMTLKHLTNARFAVSTNPKTQ